MKNMRDNYSSNKTPSKDYLHKSLRSPYKVESERYLKKPGYLNSLTDYQEQTDYYQSEQKEQMYLEIINQLYQRINKLEKKALYENNNPLQNRCEICGKPLNPNSSSYRCENCIMFFGKKYKKAA